MAIDTISTVGEEIDSKCLKCKDVTNHTIVAIAEEKIAKVQCNVCGGRHNYRPAVPAKAKKAAAAKKSPAKPKMTIAVKKNTENFAKMMKGRNVDTALPYGMTSMFSRDDLVSHPTFGLGVVSATIPPNKIELTFNEGPKVFICQLKNEGSLASEGGSKAKKEETGLNASGK